MKAKEEYVFEYCRKEPGRETIVWGPEKAVRRVMNLDSIEFCSIPQGVHVVKRDVGEFEKDYKEVFEDTENEIFFYRKLREYLRYYYNPLSRGEGCFGPDYNESKVFLETLKADRNVIYSYLGHKIEYCIANRIEMPMNMLELLVYSEKMCDICNSAYKNECDGKLSGRCDLESGIMILDRVNRELSEIVNVITEMSCDIARVQEELE